MKNKVAFVLLLSMCLMLFAGCNNEPKMLYQSNSIEIVREGNKTAVYDLLADKEYNYITKRVKRSESVSEPYTTVDTDTIKIEQGEAKHSVVITDKTDGNRQYTYKTVRVKKTGEEHTSEAHKSDNLTIITEGRYIIILDKKAGIKYRVKP